MYMRPPFSRPGGAKGATVTDIYSDLGGNGSSPPPLYEVPKITQAPSYSAPSWDESEIDTLAQKRAAGGIRNLRDQVQRVTGRTYGNPQVTRMTLREALQGYGSGLDKIMSGANEAASSEYARRYGIRTDASKTGYMGEMEQWKATNNAAMKEADTRYQSLWDKWKASNTGSRTETVQY
jgi:hypothetical protein